MNTRISHKVFELFPQLETERLLLRDFNTGDVPGFFAIRSNTKVMQFMDSFPFETHRESEEMIIQMQNSFNERQGINWAIELLESRKLIGYVGLWRLDHGNVRAEIGYSLHPHFWGQGFMKEALAEVIRFAFCELTVHSIEASVNPGNKASIGLLKNMGFSKEAYFRENYYFDGAFVDSVIYCMIESDFDSQ